MAKFKDFLLWVTVHSGHWALLFFAFVQGNEGALRVLKFACWCVAVLSCLALTDDAIKGAAKLPPRKGLMPLLSWGQVWATLVLLVWFGHIVTGLVCAWGMLMLAASEAEVKKLRAKGANHG